MLSVSTTAPRLNFGRTVFSVGRASADQTRYRKSDQFFLSACRNKTCKNQQVNKRFDTKALIEEGTIKFQTYYPEGEDPPEEDLALMSEECLRLSDRCNSRPARRIASNVFLLQLLCGARSLLQ